MPVRPVGTGVTAGLRKGLCTETMNSGEWGGFDTRYSRKLGS